MIVGNVFQVSPDTFAIGMAFKPVFHVELLA
jgi:hypothetical protein